ncbi:MAG: tRNA uridine-5-carboxymethylaminomethyl(34) synthesis GTPase MnmE [Pseudomonadales bacterium]
MSPASSNSDGTSLEAKPQRSLDTIVAEATPQGRGGVSIVRLSGPDASSIGGLMAGGATAPRKATVRSIKDSDGALIDQGLLLYFKAPHSFTGEDVVEFQLHGGPVVVQRTIQCALDLGARMARPGEFSERAFLNDKLDLVQLEAVADLISSENVRAAKNALESLQGVFSEAVHRLVESTTELRVYVEAAIDFSDEEGVDFLADGDVLNRTRQLSIDVNSLLQEAEAGARVRNGLSMVLAGAPNAGKSSLMNWLARRDTSIVTDIAGTTRDVVREEVLLDGWMFQVSDTAGIRETEDPVEIQGVRRSRVALESADLVVFLIDAQALQISQLNQPGNDLISVLNDHAQSLMTGKSAPGNTLFVINKIDLLATQDLKALSQLATDLDHVALVSMTEPAGLETLRTVIVRATENLFQGESRFSARERHVQALSSARRCIDDALLALESGQPGELVAEDLRRTQMALGEITGQVTSDALLGRIFSSFCIGK